MELVAIVALVALAVVIAVVALSRPVVHPDAPARRSLGLAVRRAHGTRRPRMTQIPGITVVDVEKVLLSVAPKDEDGKAATATLTWTSSNESIVTLAVEPDGLSAWAVSGELGTATVSVTDGTITDTIDITIAAGAPSSLNLSAGTPVHE